MKQRRKMKRRRRKRKQRRTKQKRRKTKQRKMKQWMKSRRKRKQRRKMRILKFMSIFYYIHNKERNQMVSNLREPWRWGHPYEN